MKTTPYALGALILLILAVAIGLAFNNKDKVGSDVVSVATSTVSTTTQATTTIPNNGAGNLSATSSTPNASNKIRVQNPTPNQTIATGFELRGEAVGNWYFEASFPAKLLDANGKLVSQFVVTADGEWMTTSFVPFSETVTFSIPGTPTGFLVLEKDNPTGMTQYDEKLVVPIKFATSSAETTSLKVFFINNTLAGVDNVDCSKVYSVTRVIPKTTTTGKASIEELLKGPSAADIERGYSTNVASGVKLNSLTVTNGVAYADFNEMLDKNIGGSCLVTSIRSQIEQTLKQFTSIKQVVLSINGKQGEVLQP